MSVGGVSDTNALSYLNAGASHVIVTSYVFRDGIIDIDRLESLSKLVGKNRLVLDLSCRRKPFSEVHDDEIDPNEPRPYYVVTNKWTKFTSCELRFVLFNSIVL